jgi:transposase
MAYVKGESRDQTALFPLTLDELIPADHMVRVIDAWVGTLDVGKLGFNKSQPAVTGRPPYDPSDLIKLYLYGYLNQIRSSRKLERECQRNVELMWLMGRLAPDFKTIANFRRENGKAFMALCRSFTRFCRGQGLIGGELVAIDGSKFQAVTSTRQVVSRKKLEREIAAIDGAIAQYMTALEAADESDSGTDAPAAETIRNTLRALNDRRADAEITHAVMTELGIEHHVQGENDARLMHMADGTSAVAFNVQTAVDAKHSLIVHHDVTQDGSDHRQLVAMAEATKRVMERSDLTVVADGGYSSGEQLASCERQGITAYVPPKRGTNNQGDGSLFPRSMFVFDASANAYCCPADQLLLHRSSSSVRRCDTYAATGCGSCALKPRCTSANVRYVTRSWDEAALERAQQRCDAAPEMMSKRRSIVEHPFGIVKQRVFGDGRLLLRGLPGARTEMAMAVLAFNFKRVFNMLGAAGFSAA